MIPRLTTIASVQAVCAKARSEGRRIGLVPTMGALHEGHLSLVRLAHEYADFVVVSIFVNPTQFGPAEDFSRYPRTLDRDCELLTEVGADVAFIPDSHEIYPEGYSTMVTVSGVTEGLCGRSRPGHFQGVATVVTKLFTIVRPDCAVFGQKDAQQLAVIKRFTADLNLGVDIIAAPIVRESDGLAMSSRNRFLSQEERAEATILNKALLSACDHARAGERSTAILSDLVRTTISTVPHAEIDYIEIVDPATMAPIVDVQNGGLIAVAVRFGATRLIDNALIPARLS